MGKRIPAVISSFIVSVALLCSMPAASAENATKDDFQAANTQQKDYYSATYVPCYHSYRQALSDFKTQIKNTNFETVDQAQRVLNFLKDLKTRHAGFFGTRETVGKSRHDVPTARDAMYKAADESKDYASAVEQCNKLKTLIEARVNFLNGIKNEISAFPLIPTNPTEPTDPTSPPASGVGIVIDADNIPDECYFGCKITVTNDTDQDISDWTLEFKATGVSVYNIWMDGSGLVFHNNHDNISVTPQNKHQNCYTFPAHSTMVLRGEVTGNANNMVVSNAYFNGSAATISYVK